MKNKLTVIIPTFNNAKVLPRAIRSLAKQTKKDFTCIVVDDGSTDGTSVLVEKMKKEVPFPIEYYYQTNGGGAFS